ncbi:MAG: hypothetical protein V7634_518, partial [Bradyrhizobium sp.]
MRKTLSALCVTASFAASFAVCSTPASAQDKTFDLKISHWVPA